MSSMRNDFALFAKTCLPGDFRREWTCEQLAAIEGINLAAKQGGLYAVEMPRGGGSTTLCFAAAMWAALCGHSDCVVHISHRLSNTERWLKGYAIEHLRSRGPLSVWVHSAFEPAVVEGGDSFVLLRGPIFFTHLNAPLAGLKGARRRPFVVIDSPLIWEESLRPADNEKVEDILATRIPAFAKDGIMLSVVHREGDAISRVMDGMLHPSWSSRRLTDVRGMPGV